MDRNTTAVNPTIRYDSIYITTVPGILKVVEVILNLLGFICVISLRNGDGTICKFFNTVAMSGFIFSSILLVSYLFYVTEKFHTFPWIKIDSVFCGIWMILNLIAAAYMSTLARYHGPLFAATVFGFIAVVVYGVDGLFKYHELRK